MKKWLLCLLLVLCVGASAAYAESPAEMVMSVIQEEFAELYSDKVRLEFIGQLQTGESVEAFVLTDDQYAESTLFRPWIYGWKKTGDEEIGADALMNTFYMLNAVVAQMGSAISQMENSPISAEAFTVLNQSQFQAHADKKLSMQANGYFADGEMDLLFIQMADEQGAPLTDEMFIYCRFGTTLEEDVEHVVTMLMTDQESVAQIVSALEGQLPQEVNSWYERRTGNAAADPDEEEKQLQQVRIHQEGDVNVRQESSVDSARVGKAQAGAVYPCYGVADNGWFEIELEDGTRGFVSPKMATVIE